MLPGCRVAAGVLPGCCRVLPGCRVPGRTSSQLVWALRLPGCRVAGYCRVLPGTAGLPGRCRVGVVAGSLPGHCRVRRCRVAGARAQRPMAIKETQEHDETLTPQELHGHRSIERRPEGCSPGWWLQRCARHSRAPAVGYPRRPRNVGSRPVARVSTSPCGRTRSPKAIDSSR